MPEEKSYDVIIVGGGVTGTALLYVLSRHTNIGKIALIEKENGVAKLNSHVDNNSHTLHFGDIETNYSLEKARTVKEAADMVKAYVEMHGQALFRKTHKIVLAVGETEVKELEERYLMFKELFPGLRLIGRDEISVIEPNVVSGRDQDEKIAALLSEDGYAVNFQKLSESFAEESLLTEKEVEVFLAAEVTAIQKDGQYFIVKVGEQSLRAKVIVVAAGPHSLIFAKKLGYGLEYGLLPVAGSFYSAGSLLNGKVYTMQIKGIPFAAVHGDPAVNNPSETRFGPTAKVLPLLERKNYGTFTDFIRTSAITVNGVLSLLKIISNRVIFRYFLKNILYDLPILGRWVFLQEVRKIVPSMKYGDIRIAKGIGGIRPQLVDTRAKKMEMGEAKIVGDNIIFNITPSPGASVCLKTAEIDARTVVKFLGSEFSFDAVKFRKDLRLDVDLSVQPAQK